MPQKTISEMEKAVEQVVAQCGNDSNCNCKQFPSETWQFHVGAGDTRLGYWEWVIDQAEAYGIDLSKLSAESTRSEDTYVRVGGKFPEDAVNVVERVNGSVSFALAGGGFVMKSSIDKFNKDFRAFDPELDKTNWRAAGLEIDGAFYMPGYVDGCRWNGWVMPCFTKEVIEATLKAGGFADMVLDYHQKDDAFTVRFAEMSDDDEPEVYVGKTIYVDGAKVHVYGIGAASWCWEVADEPVLEQAPSPS